MFIRGYGLVAQQHPELRRAFIRWPVPHLYEHPHSEAGVLIERQWHGEPVVLGAKVRWPESASLEVIDAHLRRFREAPVEAVSPFRQWLRLAGWPAFLRRWALWRTLYWSGGRRARRLGTFVVSSLGSLGVEQFHPVAPLTAYLTFGPIGPSGRATVKIIYDHRVMDGRSVARCLADLEEVLNTQVLEEVLLLGPSAAKQEGLTRVAGAVLDGPEPGRDELVADDR